MIKTTPDYKGTVEDLSNLLKSMDATVERLNLIFSHFSNGKINTQRDM